MKTTFQRRRDKSPLFTKVKTCEENKSENPWLAIPQTVSSAIAKRFIPHEIQ
jgi:hypothetical protein